jgi:hypothetical protein
MPRTLTDATAAAADSDSSMPYCLLQIAWPYPIGAKWYAQEDFGLGDGSTWDNAQGRVLEWGAVRLEIKGDQKVNVVGDCTIKMRDEDQVLWGYFQQIEPQRVQVTIYQQFRGNAQADLVTLHAGIVNAPCAWSEKEHAVTLDVTDISTYFDRTVGNIADRLDFPLVVQTDENKMLPIVFGSVKRARAVAVSFGPVTNLARQIGVYDMGLFVSDANKFPQNAPTTLWIDGERIAGQFKGNFFSVTQRGSAVNIGRTTAAGPDPQHIIDTHLTGGDGRWVGYFLIVTTPDGNTQRKFITSYDSGTHTLGFGVISGYWSVDPLNPSVKTWVGDPLLNNGQVYTLPAGALYEIGTNIAPHPSGCKVYLALPSYVYVVNDAPSKAVLAVEGYGYPLAWYMNNKMEEWYCQLDPVLYTVDLCDKTTCPGRTVTTISFLVPPSQLDTRLKNDDLWITLNGVENAGDSTGRLLTNPAEIIYAIHTRWMGMTSLNIDMASFTAAVNATAPLAMGFALDKQMNGLALCADLAFQARCAEVFFAGQAKLIFLTNVMTAPGSPATTGADRYLGSLDIARREWNQIITEVTGKYVDNAITETIILRSAQAEAFVGGRRAKTIDFWAYATQPPVVAVAQFWLNRWQYIWQQMALVDSLRRLDTVPYDVVDVNLAAWFGAGQIGRVMGIEQTLGGGASRAIPGIKLSAELPYFPAGACDTLAEAMPPGGCWACENSCQVSCELFCTTQVMLNNPVSGNPTSWQPSNPHTVPNTSVQFSTASPTSSGPLTPGPSTTIHSGGPPTTPHPTTIPHTTLPPTTRPPTPRHTTIPHTTIPHTTLRHTTIRHTTVRHTTGPHTTAQPTEYRTPGPTSPHTAGPTTQHTTPHTGPHTTPHPTTQHTTIWHSTTQHTAPFVCATCTDGTPVGVFVSLSDGRKATLTQVQGHPCEFCGLDSDGGFCSVSFQRWAVELTVTTKGHGHINGYAMPSPDGYYDCMASFTMTAPVSVPAGQPVITATIVPS